MPVHKDFIPEGEDPGGQGDGFRDYVPTPEPQITEEAPTVEKSPEPLKPEVEEEVIEEKKK